MDKKAFLWNDQNVHDGSTRVVKFSSLPPDAAVGYFGFIDFEGKKTLAVSLDTTDLYNSSGSTYGDFAISFAIHEGFHLWEQSSWAFWNAAAAESSTRDPDYPGIWRLRYLRGQLLANLREAPDLGAAAFWLGKLRAEYPTEVASIATTDVAEGSAQFASTTAVVLAKLGCNATPDAIAAEVEKYDSSFYGPPLAAGNEPYDLGLAAGLVMRKNGKAFEAQVATGKPMAEILLYGVSPVMQIEQNADVAAAKNEVETANATAARWITPLLARLKDPAVTRLVLPKRWFSGAYGMDEAYYAVLEPTKPNVVHSLAATMKDPQSGVSVVITNEDVVFDGATPCGGEDMITLPLDTSSITIGGTPAVASTASSTVQMAALPVVPRADGAGLAWLCPIVAPPPP